MARDWMATLWPASFKGVPFEVEKDDLEGGRRIASHEFPHRDDPQHEDLGSAVARWQVTAYVASDAADAEAAALIAVLDTATPGVLVLPVDGPVQARAHKWQRQREKDKAGYVALSITFLREGAATFGASLASLAQVAFDAVDGLGAALRALDAALSLPRLADWVAEAAEDGLVDIAAEIDLAVASVVDVPSAARGFGDALAATVAAIETRADVTLTAGFAAALAGLGLSLPAAGTPAVEILWSLARAVGDTAIGVDPVAGPGRIAEVFDWSATDAEPAPTLAATASRLAVGRNAAIVEAMRRVIGLSVEIEALVRIGFGSRRDGVAARSTVVDGTERLLALLSSLGAAETAAAVTSVVAARDAAVDFLTRTVADLAPVRTVVWVAELPAAVAAWRLWGDPTRAGELVARNRVKHPGFMPTTFEALVV